MDTKLLTSKTIDSCFPGGTDNPQGKHRNYGQVSYYLSMCVQFLLSEQLKHIHFRINNTQKSTRSPPFNKGYKHAKIKLEHS